MNNFLASMFIYTLTIGLSVLVMINGWGLKPVSWWWIIGGGVVLKLLVEIMNEIAKSSREG